MELEATLGPVNMSNVLLLVRTFMCRTKNKIPNMYLVLHLTALHESRWNLLWLQIITTLISVA
jgi:hypothetical protein